MGRVLSPHIYPDVMEYIGNQTLCHSEKILISAQHLKHKPDTDPKIINEDKSQALCLHYISLLSLLA